MDAIFRIEREKQNFLFYKEYENDFSISGFHSHLELYFVDDGEMDITVNSHYRKLKKGEMCVVLSVNVKRKCTKRASENVQFRRVAYSVTFIKGVRAALLPLTNIPSYAFLQL